MLSRIPPFVVCAVLIALMGLPFLARYINELFKKPFEDGRAPVIEERGADAGKEKSLMISSD